jgi:hypothetical protein
MARAVGHGVWVAALAAGCDGGDGDGTGTDEPLELYACTQIATGEVVDVAATREEARSIEVGRTPWRVNLLPGVAGFVGFETEGAAELTLVLNYPGVAAAWWDGDTREAFAPGEPNPNCDEDLPELQTFTTSGGPAWLELGPANQGSVWLMLGE